MKYWLALLMLISAPAWAGWTKVTEGEKSELVLYVDLETIKKYGNSRIFWRLLDYKTKDSEGRLSAKVKMEIDCKEERSRILAHILFVGNMGAGGVLGSNDKPSTWRYVSPDSIEAGEMQFVCKK